MRIEKKPGGYRYLEKGKPDFWDVHVNFDYKDTGELNQGKCYRQYRLNTTLYLKNEIKPIIQNLFDCKDAKAIAGKPDDKDISTIAFIRACLCSLQKKTAKFHCPR